MAGQFGEMVPGENCFSLNFGSPTMNGSSGANDGPLGAGSAASSPMPVTPSSMLNDPKNRPLLPNGKKTKGRVKIRMEFIDNKLRRYTTFSKRKTGIMKKAYELSTLTGTQVMLLVASETGHVYTFATKKLQPMITSEAGKALIQTCLNSPDGGNDGSSPSHDSMSAMTNFHTSEIAPSGLMNISTTGSSVATSNGGGSSRKKARSSQHSLTFSLNETLQAKNNSKSYYANDLPTMVQPTSIFSSGSSAGLRSSDDDEDEIEEDEDGGMTPSPTSPLVVDHVMTSSASNVTPSGGVNSSHHHHQQAMAGILQAAMCNGGSSGKSSKQQQQHSGMPSSVGGSPLFPFASFIPASSASQNQPAFGFLPGMNGAFMYQMPQGLVIPTMPFGDGSSGGQQNIMIANAGDGNGQTGQQQFITIPVPMALTQQMLASQILGNMAADGSLKKTKTEDEESD